MIPAGYWSYELIFDVEIKQCNVISKEEKRMTYFILSFFTMTFSIFIILASSIITVRRLSKPQLIQAHLNQQQQAIRRKRARSAVSMVLSSTLLYACCWFPVNFLLLHIILENYFSKIALFESCIDWISLLYITVDVLPAVNAGFSPFIYIIFLPDFKKAAERVLCRCKTTTNQRDVREEIPLHHVQSWQTKKPSRQEMRTTRTS